MPITFSKRILQQEKGQPANSKIVKNARTNDWDTTPVLDDKFENMVKPLYSYLINAPVKDGIVRLSHTIGEIVMFFEVPQRAAIETMLAYLVQGSDYEGYKWYKKPKDLKEFTEKMKSLVPNTRMEKEPHNSVIYEQMQLFMERLLTVEQKLDLIVNSLI